MASGASLLDRKKSLLHTYLAVTAAHGACRWRGACFRARSATGRAGFHRWNADFGFIPAGGVFQADVDVVAQVGATIDVSALSAPRCAAENITKNIGERISEITESLPTRRFICGDSTARTSSFQT